jgi:hypothetical protein
MADLEQRIIATMSRLVQWLVDGDVAAIERYTQGRRLSADLLQKALAEYGKTLVMPPRGIDDLLDVVEVLGSDPRTWSVQVNLWTKEEGRSDLTLECTLTERTGELLAAEVDNLHVL